jgi:hypothetical protein
MPSASLAGTRQRGSLWRVPPNTLGKGTGKGPTRCFFVECLYSRHSAKSEPLPSVNVTLNNVSIAITWRCDSDFSLPRATWHSAKVFVECPIKSTRQRSRCRCTVHRDFFGECHTWKSGCRVFSWLCRVLQALGKAVVSSSVRDTLVSVSTLKQGYPLLLYKSTVPTQLSVVTW